MVPRLRPEVALHAGTRLGESPVWDDQHHVLRFLDIETRGLYAWDPRTDACERHDLDEVVTAISPSTTERLIAATTKGFGWVTHEGQVTNIEPDLAVSGTRMNDGSVDSTGRFWAGSGGRDSTSRRGRVWTLTANMKSSTLLDGVGMSNGFGWTPGAQQMLHVDTHTREVNRYTVLEFEHGPALADRRTVVKLHPSDGKPDGLVVDESGAFWLAVWGAGEVRRYTPSGRVDSVIEVGTAYPTSSCFQGDDRHKMFITTARLSHDETESAGAVFAVSVTTPGVRTRPFGP